MRLQPVALAQQRLHFFLGDLQALALAHFHVDGADGAGIGEIAAEHALARGAERHQHDVVLVLTEARLAFLRHHPDHGEGDVAHPDDLTERIGAGEQVLRHRLADQRHLRAACDLFRLEQAAALHIPFARLEPAGIDAIDDGRPVLATGHDLRAPAHERRGRLHD